MVGQKERRRKSDPLRPPKEARDALVSKIESKSYRRSPAKKKGRGLSSGRRSAGTDAKRARVSGSTVPKSK